MTQLSLWRSFRFVVIVFALIASRSASAQIEGGVTGMTLRLYDAKGNIVGTSMTKEDGSWSVVVPKAGEYSIAIADAEFANARTAMNEVGISARHQDTLTRTVSLEQNDAEIIFSWSMKDDASISCYIAARDANTGLPTGDRRHAPVQYIKDLEKMAPIIICTQPCTLSGNASYTAIMDKSRRK